MRVPRVVAKSRAAIRRCAFIHVCASSDESQRARREYGRVESVRIRSVVPARPGMSRRVALLSGQLHSEVKAFAAYVVFADEEEARRALAANGRELHERHLRVDLAASAGQAAGYARAASSVFVGNLPFACDEEELRAHFAACGRVASVRVVRDRETGLGKGFAYVSFEDPAALAAALLLDGRTFQNRPLRVMRARPAPVRSEAARRQSALARLNHLAAERRRAKRARVESQSQAGKSKPSKKERQARTSRKLRWKERRDANKLKKRYAGTKKAPPPNRRES